LSMLTLTMSATGNGDSCWRSMIVSLRTSELLEKQVEQEARKPIWED